MKKIASFFIIAILLITACARKVSQKQDITLSGLSKTNFRTEVDGKQTYLFVLSNKKGMEVCITNFGGRIVSIMVPHKNGQMKDVVLGFDSIQDYINTPSDFGASIGRYANRISKGLFELDNVKYQLSTNNFGHCLHGGSKGFQYVVYDAVLIDNRILKLSYLAIDGEQGFPGNMSCDVLFTLTEDNTIAIKYSATADKPTIVNMTNHSYFNLDGNPNIKNTDWLLTLNADNYTPIDSTFITTGEIVTVEGTPFDFRKPMAIGKRINNENQQLKNGNGYDHNWVLNTGGDISKIAATLKSKETGIILDVYTTEPGIQLYTGNFLDSTIVGKKRIIYQQRASVCLETQKYPDSPNKENWPSPILRPKGKYESETIFKFSVE